MTVLRMAPPGRKLGGRPKKTGDGMKPEKKTRKGGKFAQATAERRPTRYVA